MIFKHCKLIQEDGCILFYRYSRVLKGYEIAGLIIADSNIARISFAKIWKYFVSEIVRGDDIYCSIVEGIHNNLFTKYTIYHDTIDGIKIYKVKDSLKTFTSQYTKHLEVKK
ncbi:MAG: hypothetical protein U9O94_05925 [Nanoarchaeota archaeon]|nr:hypothetical protein [Nanoarchaeota archaeon]